MSFMSPPPAPAAPVLPATTPAPPPAFGLAPMGQKPKAASSQPTVLGGQLTASPAQQGGKTLLGQ